MKKNIRASRMLTVSTAILLLIGTVILAFSGCGECKHENTVDEVTVKHTCGMEGKMVTKCTDCGYSTESSVPATELHNYGGWVQSSQSSMYRTCTACGAVESSHVSGADNAAPVDTYTYTTFSSFEKDCLVNGSDLTYNGTYNKIVVSLGGGNYTNNCQNKNVIVPARVTDIHFVGISTGSPFSNFTIECEERVNDINITFNDVRIESDSTIITSTSRYIDVNIKMLGRTCLFKIIRAGERGVDGNDGVENNDPDVYGGEGGKGISAFKINGTVTINTEASSLEIQGGDGGNGGNGGHIVTSKAPRGGRGGDGGDGVEGEELATVYVAKNCVVNIQGGSGGSGGAGGKSDVGYFGSGKKGPDGDDGAAGISGCTIIYEEE